MTKCKEYINNTCLLNVKSAEISSCMKRYPFMESFSGREQIIKGDSPIRQIPVTQVEANAGVHLQLVINISIEIQLLVDYSDSEQKVTVFYSMILRWIADAEFCAGHLKRLCAQGLDFHDKPLRLKPKMFDLVWRPDLYPVNSVYERAQQDAFNRGEPLKYILIRSQNGTGEKPATLCNMKMVVFAEIRMYCRFDFGNYPNDIQVCNLTFRSFRYDKLDVKLQWSENTDGKEDLRVPEPPFTTGPFVVVARPFTGSIRVGEDEFDTIIVEFTFRRLMDKIIMDVYLPSALQVISSISTFWLPLESISDRIIMASTCVISLIQTFIDVRASLPPSSSVSMLEIWLVVCVIFVTLQIIEAVAVQFLLVKKRHEHEVREEEEGEKKLTNIATFSERDMDRLRHNRLYWMMYGIRPSDSYHGRTIIREQIRLAQGEKKRKRTRRGYFARLANIIFMTDLPVGKPEYLPAVIDLYSRVCFLCGFAAFVLIYWSII